MKALKTRHGLLPFTAVVALCTALLPAAQAQQPDQTRSADDDVLEEIVVTGSRITRAGFDTLQPATVIDDEFMRMRGFDNAAQPLNELPQFGIPGSSNQGGQESNNVGQNIVNLFGLGSQRTLTLINGRRTVGQNTPNFGGNTAAAPGLQVDLNIIPTRLIDRIETIETGGAPIYGSDAIAGTVNIILKDDYEGMEMDFQAGVNENGDGESWRYRSLLGANFSDDRGNVVMSFEWSEQTALDASDRPDLVNSPAFVPNPLDTGPSDGIVDSFFMPDALNVFQVPNSGYLLLRNDAVSGLQDANGNPTFGSFLLGADTPVLPSNASGDLVMLGFDGDLVNVADANLGTPFPSAVSFFSQGADGVNNPFVTELDETNTFVSPLERFNLNGLGHYDLTDSVRVFFEGLYARSEAVDNSNQPPWSTLFFNNANNGALGNYRINMADNPYVSQEIRDLFELNGIFDPTLVDDPLTPDVDESDQYFWVSRSNVDIIGDSPNFLDQDVFRFVVGVDGDFSALQREWGWELAYVFGQTNSSTQQTVINGRRLSFATDVVTGGDGSPVCRVTAEGATESEDDGGLPGSGTNFDFVDCVPINILDFGSLSDEARSYVVQRQGQTTRLQQTVVEGNITGTLFEIPGGPVDFAAGVTHRREEAGFDVSQGSQMGVPPNPPTVPVSGGFDTWEFYGETLVPIIAGGEGIGFLDNFIEGLSFEGAIRTVDNNFAGRDNTWTAGGRITPAFLEGMMTIRGNYTEAIRSPAVTELFLPQTSIGTFATDPCDQRDIESGNNPAVRRANCEAAVAAASGTLEPGFTLDEFRAISRNASQSAITGGNSELKNERSSAYSVGIIMAPEQFVPGLEFSVDYTEIEIEDAIVNLSATNIMAACFDSGSFPDEPACQRFERDPVTFQPRNFVTGFVNAAERRFRALTFQGNYGFDLSDISAALNGSLGLSVNYFRTERNDQRVGAGDLNIFAGTRGFEEDKFQANITYALERFTGLLQWRGDLGGVFSANDLAAGNFESRDIQEFPSFHIFNLTLGYDLFDNTSIQVNVNNLFDAENKALRQAATGSNTNFLDDVFGRRYLVTIGSRFR
jgi:outer membrane receptor protein involved in Fe transport